MEKHYRFITAAALFALLAGAAALLPADAAHAQRTFSQARILKVAFGATIDPINRRPFAMLEHAGNGTFSLVVRSINRSTGLREGSDFRLALSQGVIPVDMGIYDFTNAARDAHLLVLDAARRIHQFPLGFADDGTPSLAGEPTVLGPFGGDHDGAATALAVIPAISDGTSNTIFAIGTQAGHLICVSCELGPRACEPVSIPISSAPITDIEVVPQAGCFAFAAVTGGRLVGVNPDANRRQPGLQPAVTFSLSGPNGAPLSIVDIDALDIKPTDSPFTEPRPVRIVAANGSPDVTIAEIPADPGLDGLLKTTEGINRLVVDIVQVEVGSLLMLAADGTGVLYQPNSTPEGGFSDPTLTLAGATMSFSPQSLNLRSNGQYVTATIEVENNRASGIMTGSLLLSVVGVAGSVPASPNPLPQLEDSDGNGIDDLTVKFDRTAVAQLLRGAPTDTPTVRLSWNNADGTDGAASARIRAIR